MKVIIAGSRHIDEYHAFYETVVWIIEHRHKVDEWVSGCCSTGPDQVPFMIKRADTAPIKVKEFPADWDKHGKAAGPIRNKEMAEYADALLLIWDGASKGSANMKQEMEKLLKPVYEVIVK